LTPSIADHFAEFLRADSPFIIALVGSNGAGKTTFFETFLRHTGIPFVNADEIARRLGLDDPYEAARLADLVRDDHLARAASFCTETVFSDARGEKIQWLRRARAVGFRGLLVWIRLESVELSAARVQQRVEAGGHDVPDEKLVDRFERTVRNARDALAFVDLGIVLDNSAIDRPFRHLETWKGGVRLEASG
jgi:predicted ABC-type ATPase